MATDDKLVAYANAIVGNTCPTSSEIHFRIRHSYSKTVAVIYPSVTEVPSTYFYEEYSNVFSAWFSGRLDFVSATAMPDGKVEASFQGLIYGDI